VAGRKSGANNPTDRRPALETRAVRRPVDGHGRRFDGTWTGTVRHATAVISTTQTTE
jgi:hypothetical protein